MSEVRELAGTMIQLCACLNLRKANRALTQFYDRLLRPAGIRSTQLPILTTIASAGPLGISQLANLTVMDQSTLTRNLKFLKEKKLIRVRPGKDKRMREVILTDKGARLILEAHPLWQEAQSRIADELGQPRFQQLLSVSAATIKATKPG